MKSILQTEKKCFITGSLVNLQEHHIFFGIKNRSLSEKYGLKVWLIYEMHEGTYGVHGKFGKELDLMLKKTAQKRFEEYYPELNFLNIFGKNYL